MARRDDFGMFQVDPRPFQIGPGRGEIGLSLGHAHFGLKTALFEAAGGVEFQLALGDDGFGLFQPVAAVFLVNPGDYHPWLNLVTTVDNHLFNPAVDLGADIQAAFSLGPALNR